MISENAGWFVVCSMEHSWFHWNAKDGLAILAPVVLQVLGMQLLSH